MFRGVRVEESSGVEIMCPEVHFENHRLPQVYSFTRTHKRTEDLKCGFEFYDVPNKM